MARHDTCPGRSPFASRYSADVANSRRRPFRSDPHEISPWPIHATVPILFELQLVAFALLLVFWMEDWSAVMQVLRDPVMTPVMVWAIARASESVLPPCLLYLGVSEPGQFEVFRYLASSRAWLAVSAIDQENPEVNRGDVVGGPLALIASFASDFLRRAPGLRLIVFPFPRRRLESIRTSDDVWESSVQSLIRFVPLLVADVRTPSAIVNRELVWILRAEAHERLVLVTRPDGTTALTALLHRLDIDLHSVARLVTEEQLSQVVAQTLDEPRRGLVHSCGPTDVAPEQTARLATAITKESTQQRNLLDELIASKGSNQALDAAVQSWADGPQSTGSAPPYTSSLSAAVGLVRRRLDKCSYSLHIGSDDTAWVDLAVQSIARSYRLSVSLMERPLDSPAKALIAGLLNAELGSAWARQPRPVRLLPVSDDQHARQGWDALVKSCPFLSVAQTQDKWRDPVCERTLATIFGIPHDTLLRDDEETKTDELQRVIDAVQGKGSYVPRAGPYSRPPT